MRAPPACDPHGRVGWVAGTLAARTLASTPIAETWIHTSDVFHAFGAAPARTDRLWHVAPLAWRTLPYAFAQRGRELAGPVAFELDAPSGARWAFAPERGVVTTIAGSGTELCKVASRRVPPSATSLRGTGPDAVLALFRVLPSWRWSARARAPTRCSCCGCRSLVFPSPR